MFQSDNKSDSINSSKEAELSEETEATDVIEFNNKGRYNYRICPPLNSTLLTH